jgi:colanic acid/amylovoran biosynthesis glycosyltransferase
MMLMREPAQQVEDTVTKGTLRVAYLLHRFPYLSETFVMRELYWIREHDVDVYIFSLLRPKRGPIHEQAKSLLPYVRYSPFLSYEVSKAQLHFLRRSPGRYLRAFWRIIWQTYREPAVLLLMLALFPKSVYFAQQLEQLDIDHVHTHFVWIGGIAAGVAADLLGISFSIHPHAFDLFSRNQRDVRRELEHASKIITISDYHRSYIAQLCPSIRPADIAVVHCGLETERFTPVVRPAQSGPIQILSVGRLLEKKGLHYLIDACKLLADRGLTFQCRIVGDGPLRDALQAHIDQIGLSERVVLLGALEQAQMVTLYQDSDIFVLPCVVASSGDRDGIPVVLMEAMACQLPVVTTPVAGIPELVQDGETGLLVGERDVAGLAHTLEGLIVNEAMRSRLGKQGRQMVLSGFQVQHTTAELASIFHQIRA